MADETRRETLARLTRMASEDGTADRITQLVHTRPPELAGEPIADEDQEHQ